ncbi:ATP-binding protein [Actinotalea sp.]|uniref:ATP-binding protein n=1 Tax=Actinotalea sp. TaxID=1872145 RepID=UPI003567335A
MLRRLGIRGKVLAALTGPVLVLVLIAGLLSWQSVTSARTTGDGGKIAELLLPHADVVVALQAERTQATNLAAGRPGADVETARAATDRAVATLSEATASLPEGILDGRIDDLVGQAENMQAGVDMVRGRIVSSGERAVDTSYSQLIANVVAMPILLSQRLTEPDLAADFRAYGLALTSSEELAHEAPVVRAVLLDPQGELESVRWLPALIALSDASLDSTRAALAALAVPGLELSDQPGTLVTLRQALSSGLPEAIAGADEAQWSLAEAMQSELAVIRADLLDLISIDAAALTADANRQAALTAGGALAAVLLSLILALTVARSIVRPMRSLTKAAVTVRDELPRLIEQVAIPGQSPDLSLAEIPVTSKDEVGRLAAAFNEVNATTIHVAQEQAALRGSIAEMFVNVARRDQVLLNRQLSFIDALERSEEDPKVLADLFRLDHLATRMRRNAESLLVLAGIDTGRRLRDTLPLSDVIRTASSEIEHYERVLLDLPADPMMLGHTALPAAHLLAELIENATMFSDPGSPVHVSTGRDETHVLITVLDQGLGMSEEELDSAHAKIASASAGEVLGAQRLGMFVIGRIAARLGAQVELAAGPHGTGTRAMVRLPLALFVDIADVPVVAPIVPAATLGQHFPVPDRNEAPEIAAVPVDLAQLTDGATGLGLPRRRVRGADTEADAPSTASPQPLPAEPDAFEPVAYEPVGIDAQPLAPVETAPVETTPVEPVDVEPVPFEPVPFAPFSAEALAEEPGLLTPALGESTIPAAPAADALAGAAATLGDDWAPLVSESAPLSRRRRGQHAAPPTHEVPVVPAENPAHADAETPRPWEDGSTRRSRKRRALLPYDAVTDSHAEPNDLPQRGEESAQAARNAPFEPFGFDEPQDGGAGSDRGPGAGLPSRTPAAFTEAWPPAASAEPVAPEARTTMFTGFRSRRAEVVAEQLEVRAPEQLAAPALEQIETPEVEQAEPVVEPEAPAFVIPSLVDDDDWSVEQDVPFGVPVEYHETSEPWAQQGRAAEPWETGYAEAADDEADYGAAHWAAVPETPAEQSSSTAWAPVSETGTEHSWAPPAPAPSTQVPVGATTPVPPPPPPPAAELPAAWAAAAPELPVDDGTAAPDFSALVNGAAPAAVEVPKARRGLFGRRAPKEPKPPAAAKPPKAPKPPKPPKAPKAGKGVAPAAPPPLILPQADAETMAAFSAAVPPVTPDRQSAWSSRGSHAQRTWGPEEHEAAADAPAADDGLSAAEELASLSHGHEVDEAVAAAEPEVVAEQSPAPVAPPVAPPVVAPVAAPAATRGTSWTPDPNAVEFTTQSAWPSASRPRTPAAAEQSPVEDDQQAPEATTTEREVPTSDSGLPVRTPTPAAPGALPARSVPAQQGFTTFVPSDDVRDDDPLSLRAGIAQQALAELSELSAYRPQAVGSAQPLVRRTPVAVPKDEPTQPRRPAAPRDANEVRSLLASFQSGTTRGRSAADAQEPVTASSDAAKQGTSW